MKNKVLALGYFDAIHKGHQMLLEKANLIAKENDSELLVCTFGDDFYKNLGRISKEVFLLSERKKIFSNLGYNNLFIFDTTKEFFNKTKEEFLQYLMHLKPTAIVVGSDYRFGKNASGSICDLIEFFNENNVRVEVADLLYEDGEKISTTLIKKLLVDGNITRANKLLGFEYFLSGNVKKGRQVGSRLGIPTANIDICPDKLPPKAGVYVAKVINCGKVYAGITNIGEHPTFDDNHFNAETHIFDFSDDIYCTDVQINLVKFVREIIRFDNKDKLIEQINKDIIFAKEEVIND
jgi:riboflavin kinase/FMN adenylyltransferase